MSKKAQGVTHLPSVLLKKSLCQQDQELGIHFKIIPEYNISCRHHLGLNQYSLCHAHTSLFILSGNYKDG